MSDEVERGCGGVPVDDDRLRVHCSRCYRFDTVADHLERARARLAIAEALALTNGAERDELRGLLESVIPRASEVLQWEPHKVARAWLAAHPAIPEAATKPSALSERPELRRWLSSVIYAYVHDVDSSEPTEAELTAELDVLQGHLSRAAAIPEGTPAADGPGCAACKHSNDAHNPECSDCGCWGFFRVGAKRCDNPRCEGSACAGETAEHDHGPNGVAPEGPPPGERGTP